ncbi:MAG: transglycosylase SLT domain-containing protein [Proteobacteria bacterium]|nr:transglycosylase SLT domain-containing protein [Pseudomonadota bacterium]
MSKKLIRFTLQDDGLDARTYDFDTDEVQIGCDPERGDNLLIELPPRLRHVRAKIFRSPSYVEMEVKTGPIWVQNSKLEEGDVVELSVGDLLIFGTKKPRGVRMRFEYAQEASIFMDDVADWSVSAAPKKKRGATAEDAFAFEEEVDPTDGMNPYERARFWYRAQYQKLTKWRKKAAKIGYWTSLVGVLWNKSKGFVAIGAGIAILATGFLGAKDNRTQAELEQAIAEERTAQALLAMEAAKEVRGEAESRQEECGCGTSEDSVAVEDTADLLDERFDGGDGLTRPVAMPNQTMKTQAGLINRYVGVARNNGRLLKTTIDRVCKGSDKERMEHVQRELGRYDLHEVYSFIPFVESQWCELAVSFTGPRGMMQFTRRTAEAAFLRIDPTQATIPNYDFKTHERWLRNKSSSYGGYYQMLAACPATVRADYVRHFYGGQVNADYNNRTDPRDPRTDWKLAAQAAFSLLEQLDSNWRGKGYGEVDAAMLAMATYNQGPAMVNRWIDRAKERYPDTEQLSYIHIYGGAMKLRAEEPNAEQRRRIKEGMEYPAKTFGYYLYTAPKLDALRCRGD